jgi:hypothetical protein
MNSKDFGRRFALGAASGATLAVAGALIFAGGAQATPDSRDPQVCAKVDADLDHHTPHTQNLDVHAKTGVHHFKVEIAANDALRELGLMCRKTMAASHGMLFEFQGMAEEQTFWMKNTHLPLDIIYIAPDGRIVSIVEGKPYDETPLPSGGPANGVLELNAGTAAKLGIRPGDRVGHPFFHR